MSESHPLVNDSNIIIANIHTIDINELYSKLNSSYNGLNNIGTSIQRTKYGVNDIPKPLQNVTAIFCCFIYCIELLPVIRLYNEYVPPIATVKRNNMIFRLDSYSLVPGDIVQIKEGEYIPADIRIISVDNSCHCMIETSGLYGETGVDEFIADPIRYTEDIRTSPNILFIGYKCTTGSCWGIVFATGENTLIAKLMKKNLWPPK